MTAKQRGYQISLLRRLHTSERYKALFADDPIAYRAFLKKHLGVDSSKELPLGVLIDLVEYMEMKRDTPPTHTASHQQLGFLRHLWSERARVPSESALEGYVKRILGYKKAVDDLTPQEAAKMIAAVKGLKPRPRPTLANNPDYDPAR